MSGPPPRQARPWSTPAPPADGEGKEEREGEGSGVPALWKRQFPLLVAVAVALLVTVAASGLLRGILLPVIWDPPFYVNPVIVTTFVIFVGLGLVMLSGPGDQGWPFYLGLVGVWIFVVAFEFSIVQWFEIQLGIRTSASRVSPVAFSASAAAVAATMLLHSNQLRRRIYNDLQSRGIEPSQLLIMDLEAGRDARRFVAQLLGLAVAASFALWITDLIVGDTGLGLDVLGILAGLVIMSVLLVYSYVVLKKGPVTDAGEKGPGGAR